MNSIAVVSQTESEPGLSGVEQTDLSSLIQHREAVDADSRMADVYKKFEAHSHDYCAVLRSGTVVGICSRAHVGFLMGHRYGFAIYSNHFVHQHMVERPLLIRHGTPVSEVLEQALNRSEKDFHEDVVLIGSRNEFFGLITIPTLVRLQSALVAERFQAQEALRHRLISVSRQAGMAEVATGVLHNVGNVLNSLNVSATLVRDLFQRSKLATLHRVAALIEQNHDTFETYVTTDPKGKLVPDLLIQLSVILQSERSKAIQEMDLLVKHVEHIKHIVAMQQNYAKVSGIAEPVDTHELVEDALEMNAGAFDRHGIRVIREFNLVPRAVVDRHKVLQILTNLLRNAKHALDHGGKAEKLLTVKTDRTENNFVTIAVVDNGIGISPENLNRIFSHGFTTKKDGHGFGLHSAALAAKEMGGTLLAHSDGLGQGATFTLEVPAEKPATM